jgi:hypothetical protein
MLVDANSEADDQFEIATAEQVPHNLNVLISRPNCVN